MLGGGGEVTCINGNIKEQNGAEISSTWLHRDAVPQPWLAASEEINLPINIFKLVLESMTVVVVPEVLRYICVDIFDL